MRRASILGVLAARPGRFFSVREIYRLLHAGGFMVSKTTLYSDVHRIERDGVLAVRSTLESCRPAKQYALAEAASRSPLAALSPAGWAGPA